MVPSVRCYLEEGVFSNFLHHFVSFKFSVERRYMNFCFGFIAQNDLPSFSTVSKSFFALNVIYSTYSTFDEEVMFIFQLLSVPKATIHRIHQRCEIHPAEREADLSGVCHSET